MGKTSEDAGGTLFYRKFKGYAENECAQSHPHNYPHDLIVVSGGVEVTNTYPDGSVEVYKLYAPANKQIKAIADHHVRSIVSYSEWWCVFPHRNKKGVLSDECEGAREAYQ